FARRMAARSGTPEASVRSGPLVAVSFADADNGIVISGYDEILHTTDGGEHWVRQTTGRRLYFEGVSMVDANTAPGISRSVLTLLGSRVPADRSQFPRSQSAPRGTGRGLTTKGADDVVQTQSPEHGDAASAAVLLGGNGQRAAINSRGHSSGSAGGASCTTRGRGSRAYRAQGEEGGRGGDRRHRLSRAPQGPDHPGADHRDRQRAGTSQRQGVDRRLFADPP